MLSLTSTSLSTASEPVHRPCHTWLALCLTTASVTNTGDGQLDLGQDHLLLDLTRLAARSGTTELLNSRCRVPGKLNLDLLWIFWAPYRQISRFCGCVGGAMRRPAIFLCSRHWDYVLKTYSAAAAHSAARGIFLRVLLFRRSRLRVHYAILTSGVRRHVAPRWNILFEMSVFLRAVSIFVFPICVPILLLTQSWVQLPSAARSAAPQISSKFWSSAEQSCTSRMQAWPLADWRRIAPPREF
ncbi:hypothetical protein C8R43DRAFT_529374 [Mycena crocata]|nr:hypothetical protein C8R43DRAFT_529374 [Mycena crocata]